MVNFLDLKRLNSKYEASFIQNFKKLLESGHYILGENCKKFEAEFAKYCTSQFALGVANGLEALELIFIALKEQGKLNTGDEVIVPANTFIASILAITNAGLVPVLVEPNEETFNLDVAQLENVLSSKTKALLFVHLYGNIKGIDKVKAFCDSKGLLLVEDAAQAHGAQINQRRAGSWGVAAGFSFYPGKNLGALGDGGGITTSDSALYSILTALRNYGSHVKYVNNYQGRNSRLDEIQAAFLTTKLADLDSLNVARVELAKTYHARIKNPKIKLPSFSDNFEHVFHLYVIRTLDRELFIKHMDSKQVKVLVHYPIAPHKQGAYKYMNDMSFPITEKIHDTVVSLPMDPLMTDQEINQVIEAVNTF